LITTTTTTTTTTHPPFTPPFVLLLLLLLPLATRPIKSLTAQDGGRDPYWGDTTPPYSLLSEDLTMDTLVISLKDGDNYLYDVVIGQANVPLLPILNTNGKALAAW